MAKFLDSGRRRDLCVLLHGADWRRGQRLKADLEDHYDARVPPRTFYDTLDSLVKAGYVEKRTEGIADEYRLTDEGQQAVEAHAAWIDEQVRQNDG